MRREARKCENMVYELRRSPGWKPSLPDLEVEVGGMLGLATWKTNQANQGHLLSSCCMQVSTAELRAHASDKETKVQSGEVTCSGAHTP